MSVLTREKDCEIIYSKVRTEHIMAMQEELEFMRASQESLEWNEMHC